MRGREGKKESNAYAQMLQSFQLRPSSPNASANHLYSPVQLWIISKNELLFTQLIIVHLNIFQLQENNKSLTSLAAAHSKISNQQEKTTQAFKSKQLVLSGAFQDDYHYYYRTYSKSVI